MFDNVSKFLIEHYSQDFASWLLGEPIVLTELSPSELSLEPIRADALILLQSNEVVLHCEVQTDPDPKMPFRMADYALRVYRRFPHKSLLQVVIYLRPTTSELVQQTTFNANRLRHEFQVVRLWEEPPELFLQHPGLLPFAALSRTRDRVGMLQTVAQRLETLPNRQQCSNLVAISGILAGLVLEKTVIQRILRRELMQESVIYQDLWETAQAEARRQAMPAARAEVQQELQAARAELQRELQAVRAELQAARVEVQQELQAARAEIRQEAARSLVLRLLTRRVGVLPDSLRSHLQTLSIEQLELLGEALLDFSSLSDLDAWIAAQ